MDVLVVEDEEALLESLVEGLSTSFEGLDVRGARSAEEAEKLLAADMPRLVVSDVRLPGNDGVQLLLSVSARSPKTPFILMSAFPSPEAKEKAHASGVKFLSKPFQFEQLVEAIESALDENHFTGEVGGISLVDLLQILNMGGRTAAVTLERRGEIGRIYFQDGQVVHAETGDLSGRRAFDHLMAWKGGSFGSEPGRQSPKATIAESFNALLLDSFRLIDEASGASDRTDEMFGEELSSLGMPVSGALGTSAEDLPRDPIHDLALRTLPGCLLSARVDLLRGIIITVSPAGKLDSEMLELLPIGAAKLLGEGALEQLNRQLAAGAASSGPAVDEAIVLSSDVIYVFQRVDAESAHAFVNVCDTSASLGTVVAKARLWRRSALRGGEDA